MSKKTFRPRREQRKKAQEAGKRFWLLALSSAAPSVGRLHPHVQEDFPTTKRAAQESARSLNQVLASCAFFRCSFRGSFVAGSIAHFIRMSKKTFRPRKEQRKKAQEAGKRFWLLALSSAAPSVARLHPHVQEDFPATKRAAEESARSRNKVPASCAFFRCSLRCQTSSACPRRLSNHEKSSARKRKKPEPGSGFLRFLPLLSPLPDFIRMSKKTFRPRRGQRKKAQEAGTRFRLLALSSAAPSVARLHPHVQEDFPTTKRAAQESARSLNQVPASCAFFRCSLCCQAAKKTFQQRAEHLTEMLCTMLAGLSNNDDHELEIAARRCTKALEGNPGMAESHYSDTSDTKPTMTSECYGFC